MSSLELNITTATRPSFRESGHMVLLPTIEGQIGILYNHIPIITSLSFGMVKLVDKDTSIIASFYVDAGVAQITNTSVNVLCSYCADASELTHESVEEKIELLSHIGGKQSKIGFYTKILNSL